MAAPADVPSHEPPPPNLDYGRFTALWKKLLGKDGLHSSSGAHAQDAGFSRDASPRSGLIRRVSRKVVPGLPRAKTWKRQQSEVREKLQAIEPTPAERRAVSVDRRLQPQRTISHSNQPLPRASAPDFLDDIPSPVGPKTVVSQVSSAPQSPVDEKQYLSLEDISNANLDRDQPDVFDPVPTYAGALAPGDVQSVTTSQYDAKIQDELEREWILNLSMHFRDKSKREKFFVTYRQKEAWRRVTISLDYRNAPDDSLEKDLTSIQFQREKSSKIYEAIRESLQDIQFYDTVTNLKLQTTDGRLHVHVVEDVNEIIHFPAVRMVQHLRCRRIRERDLEFDCHMSGFVYKVRVDGQTLIKKEIPGPDTVDEFLYEVNALNSLRFSSNIIAFYGVVVDEDDQHVKGLLISYAEQGALIDVIYDSQEQNGMGLPWVTREKWARQIVQGLSDIHEAGFVQGDFTLSNIVIDHEDNAKIIDINRRGCPVGWEPPEATPLIDSNQRISMYIGVKSDLYQLGMVLWALATLEDEPEAHRRPLRLDPEIDVPKWYRSMVEICLHDNPRVRLQATELLTMFPKPLYDDQRQDLPSISVDDGYSLQEYLVDGYEGNGRPQIKTVEQPSDWSYDPVGHTHAPSLSFSDEPYYPPRGRSPPRPLTSDHGRYGSPNIARNVMWSSSNNTMGMSASDSVPDEARAETPKNRSDVAAALSEQMAQKLKDFEADLQADLEKELALTTGGESQTKETPLVLDTDKPPDVVEHEQRTTLPPAVGGANNPMQGHDQAATEPVDETRGSETLQPEAGVVDTIVSDQMGTTAPEDTRDEGKGKGLDETAFQAMGASPPPGDEETDSGDNYIHDRRDDMSTRITEATRPASAERRSQGTPLREMPPELTGVGSAYEQQDIRQQTCSDEDLGLPTAATTQNVISPA